MDRDDHDRIVTIEETVKWIKATLEDGHICMEDHEKRIGKLEQFRSKLMGVAALGSVLLAALLTKVESFLGWGGGA